MAICPADAAAHRTAKVFTKSSDCNKIPWGYIILYSVIVSGINW